MIDRKVNVSFFFISSRRRHTRFSRDWSSDVCSSDLICVEVGGLGRLPLPVRLEVQVDADGWVPLGERGGILHLTVGRRGIYQLTPSRLRLRDALGIFEWSAQVGQPELLHILPAPDLSVPIPPRCGARAMAGDADPDGLQPYVPGTPVGRIHWPALARGAGLQQRRRAAQIGRAHV